MRTAHIHQVYSLGLQTSSLSLPFNYFIMTCLGVGFFALSYVDGLDLQMSIIREIWDVFGQYFFKKCLYSFLSISETLTLSIVVCLVVPHRSLKYPSLFFSLAFFFLY